jgi:hypothetical protein
VLLLGLEFSLKVTPRGRLERVDRVDLRASPKAPQSRICLMPSLGYSSFGRPPRLRFIVPWKCSDSDELDDADDLGGLPAFREYRGRVGSIVLYLGAD